MKRKGVKPLVPPAKLPGMPGGKPKPVQPGEEIAYARPKEKPESDPAKEKTEEV